MARRKSRIARTKAPATSKEYKSGVSPQRENESDLQYMRRLTKVANERLRALEILSKKENYMNVLKYAYANAMYDINEITGNASKTRFPTKVRKNEDKTIDQRALHKQINALTRFLESPTSTKKGIDATYKKRADTLNTNMGLAGPERLTWKELARFYENEKLQQVQKDKNLGGSDTIVRAIGAIRRIVKDPAKIKMAAAGKLKLSDNYVINKAAKDLLNEGINIEDIFK